MTEKTATAEKELTKLDVPFIQRKVRTPKVLKQ